MRAMQAAIDEGLSFHWAHMHVGHTMKFVDMAWEDGGFSTNDDGDPVADPKGNTVAQFSCEALDPKNPQHVEQCEEWYG